MPANPVSRRGLLAGAGLAGLAAPLIVPTVAAAAGPAAAPTPTPGSGARGRTPDIAETSAGKVLGRRQDGVSTFLGIPYGQAKRFQAPTAPTPWRGVRPATEYGHIAPQGYPGARWDYVKLIQWTRQPGGRSEDCQVLNVWTANPHRGKRPVLVSFHGGGFISGSGNHPGFDGAALARRGEVVVVTVNHRLGAHGFLHTADLGGPAEWAGSGTVGMQDAVLALKWVHENIENFGGDPARVLVFGQSGGGAKTSTLLAMPSAKGLITSAAVQSGSALSLATREAATRVAERLLGVLALPKSRIAELAEIPTEVLTAAQVSLETSAQPAQFAPVVDGTVIPRHPFEPDAPEVSRDVPMIISTTRDEGTAYATDPDLSAAGLETAVRAIAGESTATVLETYRDAYPTASPALILARITTDRGFYAQAVAQAERKAAQGGAPVRMYLFTWASPAAPRWSAPHGIDVPLPFRNLGTPITGDGPVARRIAGEISDAWVHLAATGDPNGPGVPAWPAYDATRRATMVFGDTTTVQDDPLKVFRDLWAGVAAKGSSSAAGAATIGG